MKADRNKISAEKLCALTGLTDRRHRQISAEGFFPPPLRGEYDLVPTLQGLFRYYREAQTRRTGTLAEEKEMKTRAERKLIELQLAKAEQQVIDAASVRSAWESVLVTVRQRLLTIPSKVAPRLPFLKSQQEMQDELHREVEEALTELSKPTHYHIESLPSEDA